MIPRYSREKMAGIWTDKSRFDIWFEIELAALEAMAAEGIVPAAAWEQVRSEAVEVRIDPERILEIEARTRHDVVAFIWHIGEQMGEGRRWLHFGMTSSDVLDTCYAIQICRCADILLDDLEQLAAALKERALEHKQTLMIGRSHGIHAEPITLGLKLAIWYDETRRNIERLRAARKSMAVGKLSGAVGTFAHLPPQVEARVCAKLGLDPAPASNQIVQRDRHAQFFTTLAVIGGTMEKIATEIRHLQRTEVYEAEEPFAVGQTGSSAMPHKRNPIRSENLCGIARLMRSYAMAALENQALWHERDISHSSVERMIGPDATVTLDFGLDRLARLIRGWVIYPERMKRNLALMGGLEASQSLLLMLAQKGLPRDEAYKLVQRNAMQVWEQGADFKKTLLADAELIGHIGVEAIEQALDIGRHTRYVDEIFARVFGAQEAD
ncbi:MAG: adenylosuccinate lyase [Candidatus Alcyoniella australis]|nr:adenylosuccinate lyase [Candidatus Alcyoniella australis]